MHSVWAVARNTFAQAMRMKIAVVVFLLLVVLLPLMSLVMDGDGTLVGKLQTFSSYGLGLISFLLCILTIAISCFTLSNDLKRKHIHLVVTKPIRRFELIIGKLIGVVLLNFILLGLFGSILYVCTIMIPRLSDGPQNEVLRADFEFFTSRIGLKPKLDFAALEQKAVERFTEMRQKKQLPEGMSVARVMGELRSQEIMKAKSIAPGQAKNWGFENVNIKNPQDPNNVIFIRYKYETSVPPSGGQVYGMWEIGDLRQYESETPKFTTPIYRSEQKQVTKTVHEFPVPAAALASDGYLGVGFFNNAALNRTTIIPEDVEVLYQTGTFTENYIRAILLIFIHLIFLTILGITLSTWLSFPVSILACLLVFFAGLTNGFIMDAINGLGAGIGIFYSFTIKPLLWLLPQFDGLYSPNGYIVDGRTLPWLFLASIVAVTLLVKGLLLLLAGMFIFSRREVAKAVV